jgi:hypothetical protein
MPTKRALIADAYAELGVAEYAFDLQPEDLQIALRRLNSMLSAWAGKGALIEYNLPGLLDDEAETPAWATDAIVAGLAISLAPTIGKAVSGETRMKLHDGMSVILSKTALPMERQIAGYAGAGNWWKTLPH